MLADTGRKHRKGVAKIPLKTQNLKGEGLSGSSSSVQKDFVPRATAKTSDLVSVDGASKAQASFEDCKKQTEIESLAKLWRIRDVQAGPKGSALALMGTLDSLPQLYWLENATSKPKKLTQFKNGVKRFWASAQSDEAIVISFTENAEKAFSLSISKPNPKALSLEGELNSVLWNKKSSIYFSLLQDEKTVVGNLDLVSGHKRLFFEKPFWVELQDASSDGSSILYRKIISKVSSEIYLWKSLLNTDSLLARSLENVRNPWARFARGEKEVLLLSDRGSDVLQLWVFSIQDSKAQTVFRSGKELSSCALASDRKSFSCLENIQGFSQILSAELGDTFGSHQRLSAPQLAEEVIVASAYQRDEAYPGVFHIRSAPTRADGVWLLSQGKWKLWFPQSAAQKNTCFAGLEKKPLLDSTSSKPYVFKYVPSIKPYPIVFSHPDFTYRPIFDVSAQLLAKQGYGFWITVSPGAEGYGKTYLSGDMRESRFQQAKDWQAFVKETFKEEPILPYKIFWIGSGSKAWGMYQALAMLDKAVSSILFLNPIYDPQKTFSHDLKIKKTYWENEYSSFQDVGYWKKLSWNLLDKEKVPSIFWVDLKPQNNDISPLQEHLGAKLNTDFAKKNISSVSSHQWTPLEEARLLRMFLFAQEKN